MEPEAVDRPGYDRQAPFDRLLAGGRLMGMRSPAVACFRPALAC